MNTIKANQLIHGQLAKMGEYDNSPHFLPENKKFVENLFLDYFNSSSLNIHENLNSCLDLGCGTGFMYEILNKLKLNKYIGIDITQEMLDVFKSKYPSSDLHLLIAKAESLPFEGSSFSLVTNYSFLDHLEELKVVFNEVYRVLRNDGIFYSGLIPNSDFAYNVSRNSEISSNFFGFDHSEQLLRENKSMYENGKVYADRYGFDADTLLSAEPQKTLDHGLCIKSIYELLSESGFKKISFCPNWFFSQAIYKNDADKLHIINNYLKSLGPVSQSLFKYFDFFAVK